MSNHGFVSGKGGKKKQKLRSMSAQLVAQHKQQKFIQKRDDNKFQKLTAKKKGKRESGAKIPYNRYQHYLTIGEGNFSFTRALVQHFMQQQLQQENQKQQQNSKLPHSNDDDEENDDNEDEEAADDASAPGEEDMSKVMDSFTAEAESERRRLAEATAAIASGTVKKKMKREGAFDANVHVPKLSPGTIFTNPSCRVVATCYDSFSDLCFKYPDVPNKLSSLVQANIPVFSGVDATALGRARPHSVTNDMLERARKLELAEGRERNEARRKRLREAEEEEEYNHEREESESDEDDEEDESDYEDGGDDLDEDDEDQPKKKIKTEDGTAAASSTTSKKPKRKKGKSNGGNFLFPPFVTRAAFQQIQQLLESKLHGSQKAKLQKRKEDEREELNEAIKGLIAKNVAQMNPNAIPAAGADGNSKKNKKKDKKRKANVNSISLLKSQHRASIVDRDLNQVNTRPRDRFHRVIFNFPHTGCGIKDTDRNNQVHREFLESVFRSIVEQRLVYPADQHGEIHITIKKGEPYKSWNIQQIAKRVPGVSFKTSREFYTHLYPGYEHRRTRGWDAEKFDVDIGEDKGGMGVDLSTGKLIKPNADITGSGAMTYVFTRARTPADDEEDRFNTKWFADYEVECEEEKVRRELLEENEKIFQKVQQKHQKSNDTTTVKKEITKPGKADSDENMRAERDGNDMEDAEAEQHEEEEEKDEEVEIEAEAQDDAGEDDDSTPKLAANFAAAFKQHFQQAAASTAAAAPIPPKKSNSLFQKSQMKGGFKKQQPQKKKK